MPTHHHANRKPDPVKYCEHCGQQLHRVRYEGAKIEDMRHFLRRRYCGRDCMYADWKAGNQTKAGDSPRYKPVSVTCPDCGAQREVSLYFRNDSRFNPYCKSCSAKRTLIIQKKNKPRSWLHINGCLLTPRGKGRCRDYLTCGHYDECLTLVARWNWDGWRAIR